MIISIHCTIGYGVGASTDPCSDVYQVCTTSIGLSDLFKDLFNLKLSLERKGRMSTRGGSEDKKLLFNNQSLAYGPQ